MARLDHLDGPLSVMLLYILLIVVLGLTMAVRITENPFKLRFNVQESGANEFTQVDIPLPLAVVGRGKAQGIELMKIVSHQEGPDNEAGQNNLTTTNITRDLQTATIQYDNDQLIHQREVAYKSVTGAAGEVTMLHEEEMHFDMTDGDGNGELLFERFLHASIIGDGNAAAKRFQGYLLCHLVEADGNEVVVQALVNDN